MAIDSERTEPRSRRAILAGALGGAAAVLASRFGSPDKASATHLAGFGHANAAGAADTSLTATTAGTALLVTQSGTGTALRGSATGPGSIAGFFTAGNGTGISGVTGAPGSYGVFASNNGAAGTGGALRASGVNNHGVVATTANDGKNAIRATGANGQAAIYGSAIQMGVEGVGYRGVYGHTMDSGASAGVHGRAEAAAGFDAWGVYGQSNAPSGARGVFGHATNTSAASNNYGVYGRTDDQSSGVFGLATSATGGIGVEGASTGATGVYGHSTDYIGVYGAGSLYAGYFNGNVHVLGTLTKSAGTFTIDHPLDPANKLLYHSFVESPDMKNVYDGVATLDANGKATVKLPAYFDKLNRDVRYQLTALGTAAPGLHVDSEAKNNQFGIAGGAAGQKVSWQITGIRQDAYAKAHPIIAEVAKTGADKGRYLHPAEHGVAASKALTVNASGRGAKG